MIACGKKKVEVIPPYKIVVVRTCILKFLHSDPPVHSDHEYESLLCFCNTIISLCGRFFFFCFHGLHGSKDLGSAAVTLFIHWPRICAIFPYLPTPY